MLGIHSRHSKKIGRAAQKKIDLCMYKVAWNPKFVQTLSQLLGSRLKGTVIRFYDKLGHFWGVKNENGETEKLNEVSHSKCSKASKKKFPNMYLQQYEKKKSFNKYS